jgi:hypothetical protein
VLKINLDLTTLEKTRASRTSRFTSSTTPPLRVRGPLGDVDCDQRPCLTKQHGTFEPQGS